MSTLVTILRPTVQLGMNSWLDFGLWRSRRVGSPTTIAEGYRRCSIRFNEHDQIEGVHKNGVIVAAVADAVEGRDPISVA